MRFACVGSLASLAIVTGIVELNRSNDAGIGCED
jgi:hypothetical protein